VICVSGPARRAIATARAEHAVAGARPILANLTRGTGLPAAAAIEWVGLGVLAEDLFPLLAELQHACGEFSRALLLAFLLTLDGMPRPAIPGVDHGARNRGNGEPTEQESQHAATGSAVGDAAHQTIEPDVFHVSHSFPMVLTSSSCLCSFPCYARSVAHD